MTAPIPSARIELSGLAAKARLETWRAINPAHEVSGIDAMDQDDGPIGITVWHLGPLLLASSNLGSLRLSRLSSLIRRDQMDHIAVAVGRGGRWRTDGNDVGFDMAPGEVSVVDMAQPIETELVAARAVQLVLPRDSLAGLDPAAAHGSVLTNGVAGLFQDYLRALEHRLPSLASSDAAAVARVTIDLFAASLRPNAATLRCARPALNLTLLRRFRRHVEQTLHDPTLTPERIATALRVSRARLYALLEPQGGVAAYLRTRRLARAYAQLCAAGSVVPVKAVAYQVGFTSEAHFSRAFRRQYGCSPTEARAGESVAAPVPAEAAPADLWLHWLRELR
jgi:AraC-like DNA-binding protein